MKKKMIISLLGVMLLFGVFAVGCSRIKDAVKQKNTTQSETTQTDTSQKDTSQKDTSQKDTTQTDTTQTDTTQADTAQTDTTQTDTAQKDATQTESSTQEQSKKEVLKTFEAKTLEGGSFTQDDLAKWDVTVINFWSLMCGPCIEEMPEIAKFKKSLPDNVEMITVCLDGSEDTESVKKVLKDAGYEGTTLVTGTVDFQKLCDDIQYTPTTIVVDKDGNMIGDPIIGGQEDLAKVYTEAINHALKAMGKAEISDENK